MIQYNDNLQNYSPKALDNKHGKFVSGVWEPYASVSEVNTTILAPYRHKGLTVIILEGGYPTEYWYRDGVDDTDLIKKVIYTQDSASLYLFNDGSVQDPLYGLVPVSDTPNNSLTLLGDGFYVPINIIEGVVYGGIVTWLNDYTYNVSAAGYYINGRFYTSPSTTVTLNSPDGTYNRIDTFGVDINGQVIILEGTPSAVPTQAPLDPAIQLELSIALVETGTTEPTIDTECLYEENIEWTTSSSTIRIDVDSTLAPCEGTVSIEGTAVISGDNISLTRSSAFDPTADHTILSMVIKSKAAWGGNNAKQRKLVLQFRIGNITIGNPVNIINGAFGFDSSITTICQVIAIPLSQFALPLGSTIDNLLISASLTTGSIGFFIDKICLQGSVLPDPPTSSITADNGLYMSDPNNVRWGGPLVENTTVTTGASYNITFTGSNTNQTLSVIDTATAGSAIIATGGSGGYGVYATGGTGVQGNSINGFAVVGNATGSGIAIVGDSVSSQAALFRITPVNSTDVLTVATFQRLTSGTAQDDMGARINFSIEASDGVGYDSTSLISRMTDVTAGTRTSSFEIANLDSGTLARKAALAGSGQWFWDEYGIGTFEDTPIYIVGVKADGTIIEVDPADLGGGGGGGGGCTEITFTVGDVGYPGQDDDTYTNAVLAGKDIAVYREGDREFPGDTTKGFDFDSGTGEITFYPTLNAGEDIIIVYCIAGGGTITADNGLNMSTSTNVQLGSATPGASTLLHNTYIDPNAFFIALNGSRGTTYLQENAININATSTANTPLVVGWTGTTGTASIGAEPSSTNSIVPIMELYRNTSGTAANGIGASLRFSVETTVAKQESNTIISKLTDATDATRTSQFIITGVNSAVTADLFTLSGNGAAKFNKYGVGSFTSGTPTYLIATDASGNYIEVPSGGLSGGNIITADNGLTANTSTNVQLGGTGIQNTSIAWSNFSFTNTWNTLSGSGLILSSTSTAAAGGAQKLVELSLSGANATSSQNTYGIHATNSHTGTGAVNVAIYGEVQNGGGSGAGVKGVATTQRGVYGEATSGSGVTGSATNGTGINGSATSGTGVNGGSTSGAGGVFTSDSGLPLNAQSNSATTNTVIEISRITRLSSGTAANNIGASLDYNIETDAGSARLSNQVISKWTTVADATRVSQLIITGVNSAVTADLFTLSGSGALKLNKYGVGTFTGTPAYTLQVDSSGNIIEGSAAGGVNIYNSNGTLTANRTVTTAGFDTFWTGSNAGALFNVTNTSATGAAMTVNAYGSGTGIQVYSDTGIPVYAQIAGSSTSSVSRGLLVAKTNAGAGLVGNGVNIDFSIKTSVVERTGNELISKWTDATDATRTSQFSITGVNSTTTQTLVTIDGNGESTFLGPSSPSNTIRSINTTGTGVKIETTSGTGVWAVASTSGFAGQFNSIDAVSVAVIRNPSSTNTVLPVMQLERSTSSTGADGIGGSLDLYTESSTSTTIANQMIWKFTTATHASRTSQLSFTGILAASPVTMLTLNGDGSMQLRPITATEASAITPAEGMIVMVSNTNGTFTSIGFWGYRNGAWAAF